MRRQLREAWRFLIGHPMTRSLAPAVVVGALGGGALFGLGLVFVLHSLGASRAAFGYLVALFGMGMAAGVAIPSWAARRELPRLRLVQLGAAAMGLLLVAMALAPSLSASFVAAVVFGASMAVTFVQGVTLLQECVEPEWRGSAFTAFHVVLRVVLAVSALGGGFLAQALEGRRVGGFVLDGTQATFVLAGLLIAGGGLLVRPRPPRRPRWAFWDCDWRCLPCFELAGPEGQPP